MTTWEPDVLGPDYLARTLELQPDDELALRGEALEHVGPERPGGGDGDLPRSHAAA